METRSKTADLPDEALKAALRFLGYRARSEAEITERLKRKGYSVALTELVLGRLRSLGYADDGIFARDWARSRSEGHRYGPRRIESELRAKGINEALIGQVIRETFSRDDESEKAKRALKKKFHGERLDDPKTLRRAAGFLRRQGYSEAVISSLLRQHED